MAMKVYTMEEMLERHIGKVGTPERDEFDRQIKEDIEAYHLGEAIKKMRLEQNLTQQQLGERIGVKRAQISKIETGGNITLRTYSRVFKALGITTASIDLGASVGKVALW
jgi:DNA-binding XRE family transcriptional regulator